MCFGDFFSTISDKERRQYRSSCWGSFFGGYEDREKAERHSNRASTARQNQDYVRAADQSQHAATSYSRAGEFHKRDVELEERQNDLEHIQQNHNKNRLC